MAAILSFFFGVGVGASMASVTTFSWGSTDFVKTTGNSKVSINGKTYSGNNIEVKNGKVWIDGKPAEDYAPTGDKSHTYNVTINGNPQGVATLGDVTVNGNCGDIATTGAVTVKGNSEDIATMGTVTVGGRAQSISAWGKVTTGK